MSDRGAMVDRRARHMPIEAWLIAPVMLSLIASFLIALPIRIFGLQAPEPVFALVPAFAWAMIRPSVLPAIALVALGLGQDLLWGTPLGFWALCLLSAYGLIFLVRVILSGQDFWILWRWYAGACAMALAVGVLLTFLRAGQAPSLIGVGLQFAVTAVLFPFAWALVERYEDADVRFR
jgi:rod shape-determining protein MreD